ncbi:hypothetical protein V5O48_008215 [Marasmius crinis-equi]|uniref:Uncharacterized protein n=1 Tax=Marasmius crinis-equi TaxID=585013 RepID=A0ABR3FEK0_9AGAR
MDSRTAADLYKDLASFSLYGKSIVLSTAGLVTTAALYGIYLVVFFGAIRILSRRWDGLISTRTALFSTLVVLFIISTSYLCCSVSYFVLGAQALLINDVGAPVLKKNEVFVAENHVLAVIGQVMFPIAVVLGDSIVIWRAWSLSGRVRKIMVLPVLLQLALTATAFSWIGCFVDEGMPGQIPARCRPMNTATYVLSMVTNVIGTAVIGYRARTHRKELEASLAPTPQSERAGKLLIAIFESGVVYATLWIIELAVLVAPTKPSFVYQAFRQVFSAAAAQLVGIYPTAMVVLIYSKRSLWDQTGKSTIMTEEHDVRRDSSDGLSEADVKV